VEVAAAELEIEALERGLAGYEDRAGAAQLFEAYDEAAATLRREVQRLREESLRLAGSKGPEPRQAAQRATVQGLQEEARALRSSRRAGCDAEAAEKRGALVRRCLDEVRSRVGVAKRRLLEAEASCAALLGSPQRAEMEARREEADEEHRHVQTELETLRRASEGLRCEIARLRLVRDAVETPPPPPQAPPPPSLASTHHVGAAAGGGVRGTEPAAATTTAQGMERFATLQRRLGVAAPQFVPLCTRVRGEMEDLAQACRRLEARQRCLQQVAGPGGPGFGVPGGGREAASEPSPSVAGESASSYAASRCGSHRAAGSRCSSVPSGSAPASVAGGVAQEHATASGQYSARAARGTAARGRSAGPSAAAAAVVATTTSAASPTLGTAAAVAAPVAPQGAAPEVAPQQQRPPASSVATTGSRSRGVRSNSGGLPPTPRQLQSRAKAWQA